MYKKINLDKAVIILSNYFMHKKKVKIILRKCKKEEIFYNNIYHKINYNN